VHGYDNNNSVGIARVSGEGEERAAVVTCVDDLRLCLFVSR
jgi:hypothetical protein